MENTIETTHSRITNKFKFIYQSLQHLLQFNIADSTDLDRIKFNTEDLQSRYNLSVINVRLHYYSPTGNRLNVRETDQEYSRIVTCENYATCFFDITSELRAIFKKICAFIAKQNKKNIEKYEDLIHVTNTTITAAEKIDIGIKLEKINYDVCRNCGKKMNIISEYSELHCPECRKIKTMVGVVFRDDQFFPQEGQKAKHNGYDTIRHYKFWIDRLQALEPHNFTAQEQKKIKNVIIRDNYSKNEINCEVMRKILKDPAVAFTRFNDHVPLLVKKFTGRSPPRLSFQENKICAARFNRIMELYDEINPDGCNKPYYPYFIYKILEILFADNPDKLRILEYIHLQSAVTVIKNDKIYKKICEIASPDDNLVYKPTITFKKNS